MPDKRICFLPKVTHPSFQKPDDYSVHCVTEHLTRFMLKEDNCFIPIEKYQHLEL